MQGPEDDTTKWENPPSTESSIPSNNKRRRALVACSSCRRRKIRCDSARPHCGNCVRTGIKCIYLVESRRKRTKNSDGNAKKEELPNAEINRRLTRVEEMLTLLLENQGLQPRSASDQTGGSTASSSDEFSDFENELSICNDADGDADDYDFGEDTVTTCPGDEYSHSDIFQLSERRAPVVVKFGDSEPLVAYSYGFTPSLLSPKSMRWLCESIGNHTLGIQAEVMLSRLWKQKTGALLDWGKTLAHNESLDPVLVEHSIRMHASSTSEILHSLVDSQDLSLINKLCCPSGDYSKVEYSSPYSLVYPALVLTATQYGFVNRSGEKVFDDEFLKHQNMIAFQCCLRQVSYISWAPTTFLLLRLLLFATMSMSQKVMFPQSRGVLSIAIYMALNLGLHRHELGRKLKSEERDRRSLMWAIIHDVDTKTAAGLSVMPLMVNYENMPSRIHLKASPGSDLEQLSTALELDYIYLRVFYKLFSRRAQKTSVKTMLKNLCEIDKKLTEWKDNLPESWKKTMDLVDEKEKMERRENYASDVNFEHSICLKPGILGEKTCMWMQVSTMICYYNIMILIHSIPAFTPSCLNGFENDDVPPRLLNSLNIISESARSTLKLSFNMKSVHSDKCLAFTATNSFSALFLKQIRDPRHPTNAEDLTQIYRYITKFRTVTDSMDSTDSQGVMNVWLIFANALTQLNREYPASKEYDWKNLKNDKSNLSSFQPSGEASAHTLTPPTSLDMLTGQQHLDGQAHQNHQNRHKEQQQFTSQAHTDPMSTQDIKVEKSQVPMYYNTAPSHITPSPLMHHHTVSPQQQQQPQPEAQQQHQQHYLQSPVTQSMGPSQLQAAQCMMPGTSHSGVHQQVSVPPHPEDMPTYAGPPMDPNHRGSTNGYELNLWETFSGMTGVDVDLNEDELLNGLGPFDPASTRFDQPPNNCSIC